ncbi:PHB depolymerase family esterase [Rivibacter subsaxonicus]|uniref:Esterase/PHB depolymerase n=1 Tax=Rivibacter subsaxonicus TaxID=457575 RepID=A0A4Q7VZE3_9BURK|nr:PHB depolymerase family esterase [Rivibacter subsaxonicus]RZU02130.1 esterase/PHB depolymerase [Rivibacter subsaxonicus]
MNSSNFLRALALVAALCSGSAFGAVALPQYNVDTSKISVSGLSAGGFMANQLGYAYSSTFMGVGVFAAGPYMCAGHSNYTACMYNATVSASMLSTMQADINNWSGTAIDSKSNVANQKIYMFVGNSDYTVGPNPMNAVQTQYTNNGVPAANLEYVRRASTAHVFPTDFDATGNNACSSSASPYISNCGYDGAKAALSKFYGTLNARNNAPAAANYIEFDQSAYSNGNPGMAATGWLYVPASCAAGTQCKLHVALHGCQQHTVAISDKFVKNTGYSRWADTNNIIVLFPQAKVDSTSRGTAASGSLANPNGCWDWVGWYGSNFAQKAGTQMAAIKAMVDRLASGTGSGGGGGGGGGTALPAPTGVGTSGATASSMVIAWGSVSGASGYNVYRGGTQVNSALVAGTSYTDTGLAAATTYSWTVAAVDASGVVGAQSSAATGATTGTAPPPATCFTSSNYAHTTAGRAHQSGGYALANGSNQNMGLWNTFVTTTLKQTSPGYYVIGTCP